ncbi:hypothetical protein L6Q21_14265 [Sandaracinobacter sp. RS1-74]|uniref:hypothetical protein n=1 Tax=Sandaracinobacteroides sayramensis TaxID=2913411 RepID=UPI001EDC02A2|nr:hypothetical protein [Sandaracinobacteroides sayramensis]MCG2842146.1 hypothetical protein [Sandaracinobacteroides sayramensis]
MNRIAKTSVALFAAFAAVVPAAAYDGGGLASAALQPQYWVIAISLTGLIGLGLGKGAAVRDEAEDERTRFSAASLA